MKLLTGTCLILVWYPLGRYKTFSYYYFAAIVSDGNAITLFRNKRFALNEMFQRNASKFAIFYA